MSDSGIAAFDTVIGTCGIAWHPAGLLGLQLPGREPLARLRRRFPELAEAGPPDWVKAAIAGVGSHLAGGRGDLAAIVLDFSTVGTFEASVYRAAREIPAGRTRTYGELAAGLGDIGLSRAVGQALGRNPWPIVIPCHRVVAADGRAGGFSAPGGSATKLRLLEIEGALAPDRLPLFAHPAS